MPSYTHPINKFADTTQVSVYPPRGGFVFMDQDTPEIFCQLMVGSGGSVIVQNPDGENRYYPQLNPGVIYPIYGTRIVSSDTLDGLPVMTSATGIWWYGGV